MTTDSTKKLFNEIKEIVTHSRLVAARHFNNLVVRINYEIGRLIIENEQAGEIRAGYGRETLIKLSYSLTQEFGRGYSVDNLELKRKFYITYKNRISESLIRKLRGNEDSESILNKDSKGQKSESLSRIFEEKENPFPLSWTHYIQLIKMDDKERNFYEVESINNNWSVRELLRQYNSSLFERVALSKNKDEIVRLSNEGQVYERPSDILKQPYILEFLGLKEEPSYTESQLEQAIIDKIEFFLLELGKGFLFEARQKRISFEDDDFYIDLVFYNRMLRCYVLIDLKIGKLTHGDIGQMQMYVNYFDRMVKLPEENRTVGIILCKQNNKTVVEFTLPEGQDQIFSREYKLYLPDKEELKKQLNFNTCN
ncbi:MAG: PDDEXK nuclease domain-containing protein [Bacteroidales bacterium]|nr:PDDEXK nuclease domain-containing protein [Bacteroidales bacterium]